MILPDFVLPSRCNQIWKTSGIDSLEHCGDRQHFESFPHAIEYCYNSRGFRDHEWPQDFELLQSAIWCIGDSYTVGLGSPQDQTWCALLSKQLNRRCINLGFDGASNQWIARKAAKLIQTINPKLICIHWSFLHRAESNDIDLNDEQRRMHFDARACDTIQLMQNFIDLFNQLEADKGTTNIVHSIIPSSGLVNYFQLSRIWNHIAGSGWPKEIPGTQKLIEQLPQFVVNELKQMKLYETFDNYATALPKYKNFNTQIDNLYMVEQTDYARDSYHYGSNTTNNLVQQLCQQIVLNDW